MRVLFFGSCPMPFEKGMPAQGTGIRSWQLIKPVCDAGHEVMAFCLRTDGCYPDSLDDCIRQKTYNGFILYNMSWKAFTDEDKIKKIASEFKPDAIIGAASVLPNYMASRMRHLAPFWADCFGDPISEIQAKAELYGRKKCSNEIFGVWKYYRYILASADHFSALSDAQNHALVGELAILGRLGFANAGKLMVHTIPCGVEEAPPLLKKPDNAFLRGKKFPKKSFVVCFSGSYNTWMDPVLLFNEMEKAMSEIPELVFLSIGGGTKGYNEKLYNDFCKKIKASKYRERYILCGWVPFNKVPEYYAEADIGINIDRFTYEGVLGSRNRIVQFLAHGIPVVSTPLSEISRRLSAESYVYPFKMKEMPPGAPECEDLAALLVNLSKDRKKLAECGRKGREHVVKQYNYPKTAVPLLNWLKNPVRSSDNSPEIRKADKKAVYLNEIKRVMDYEKREALIHYLSEEKSRLDRIRKSPVFRIRRSIKRLFKPKK
jgi:glycosyltransferase involved in cell wall biosynthesis